MTRILSLNLSSATTRAAMKAHFSTIQPDIDAAIAKERARICEVILAVEQAGRIGVQLDLSHSVSEGHTADDVRAFALEQACLKRSQK